ncbi:S-layer homology domain-containing protein [Sporosarcina psychrophila]|uniref:S-layer homology domain-containing protein n=1 Tax=Sporosarcina psychrophila TaxID=1476 RepID=UPI003B9ED6FB
MKKFTMALVAFLLVFTIIPIAKAETGRDSNPFSDLKGPNGDIIYLYNKNIIGGYPDGTFRPNEPITRAQVAAMLVKALDFKLIDKPTVQFKDVSNISKHYQTLATVSELGILRGENGYMRPGEITTRAQMAAILRRAFELPMDNQPTFVDVSPANWAFKDINSLAKNLIAGGYQDGTFKPGNPVTRSQFSSFLARALDDKMKLAGYRSAVSEKGVEVERDGWIYTVKTNKLVKINQKTKEEIILLSEDGFSDSDGYVEQKLRNGFPIILFNNQIFTPYWKEVDIKSGLPTDYGLMVSSITGEKLSTTGDKYNDITMYNLPNSNVIRNVTLHNFEIYFTIEKKVRQFDKGFNEEVNTDDMLILYSADQIGFGIKKVHEFDARVIFDDIKGSKVKPNVNQNNKSIKYDSSAMYYFNKKGVFAYSMLNGKTKRLSTIQAQDMTVMDTEIIVEDSKGKKHILKK